MATKGPTMQHSTTVKEIPYSSAGHDEGWWYDENTGEAWTMYIQPVCSCGWEAPREVASIRHSTFIYRVGDVVEPVGAPFDPLPQNECAPGIHFFITRREAEDYR